MTLYATHNPSPPKAGSRGYGYWLTALSRYLVGIRNFVSKCCMSFDSQTHRSLSTGEDQPEKGLQMLPRSDLIQLLPRNTLIPTFSFMIHMSMKYEETVAKSRQTIAECRLVRNECPQNEEITTSEDKKCYF